MSLVATWAVAAQIRTGATAADETEPMVAAEPVQDAAPTVRIVGAASPQVGPTPQTQPAVETAAPLPLAASTADPKPAAPVMAAAPTLPAAKPTAAPSVDLSSLPVLELDEAAFDAVPAPNSDVSSRGQGRP